MREPAPGEREIEVLLTVLSVLTVNINRFNIVSAVDGWRQRLLPVTAATLNEYPLVCAFVLCIEQ